VLVQRDPVFTEAGDKLLKLCLSSSYRWQHSCSYLTSRFWWAFAEGAQPSQPTTQCCAARTISVTVFGRQWVDSASLINSNQKTKYCS